VTEGLAGCGVMGEAGVRPRRPYARAISASRNKTSAAEPSSGHHEPSRGARTPPFLPLESFAGLVGARKGVV
jgi:hypothetical protein